MLVLGGPLASAMIRELNAAERFLVDAVGLTGEARSHMLDQAAQSLESAAEFHAAIHGEANRANLCGCPAECSCNPPF
jgi:hypothetical protein